MRNIASIEAPSILGLKPGGVEKLPEALKAQGLLNRIPVVNQEKIIPPSYNPQRDVRTNILNPKAIRQFTGFPSSSLCRKGRSQIHVYEHRCTLLRHPSGQSTAPDQSG